MTKIPQETKNHLAKRIEARAGATAPPTASPQDLVVIARNPAEMQVAQQKLVAWAVGKLAEVQGDLEEAEESMQLAADNGWRMAGFQKCVRLQKDRLNYYTKVHAALEAGYVIVPNFDLDIFAIRTTKTRPGSECTSSRWSKPTPDRFEQKTNRPLLGDGSYCDPWPELKHKKEQVEDGDGKSHMTNYAETKDWRSVDFPFKFAKPQILDDTARAMALKIFDEIGVTPHRLVRKQDPMVIGQIVFKNSGHQDKRISFLVTWWLAQSDIEV